MALGARNNHLRVRHAHEHGRVTFVELFFDLVFVFAITQLSHSLLEHLTLVGLLQTGMVFLAVWWAWIDTSWVTNWLDPERTPVRLMLLALMLAGLAMSTSIPDAFTGKALVFAVAYAGLQVGRSLFMMWATRHHDSSNYLNYSRITTWSAAAGVLYVTGALLGGGAQVVLWSVGLAMNCIAPITGFWTPGLGAAAAEEWTVEGGHLAERCGLFIIIALGESILVTGATYGGLEPGLANTTAFAIAFVGSVAMWWIYFDTGAERGSRTIAESDAPGRLARMAYTYFHMPLVAGIVISAVGDELVLAHPTGHAEVGAVAAVLAGPALYLIGNILFKRAIASRYPRSHLVGLGLLAAGAAAAPRFDLLVVTAWASLVLVLVAFWETWSLRGGRKVIVVEP